MTSNLGSQLWMHSQEVTREQVQQILQYHFKPEFLNRIDQIIVFHALDKAQLREIVKIQLGRMISLLEKRNIKLDLTESAIDYLADAGYDPDYGARPLKRAIQKELQDKLALSILQGDIHDGDRIEVNAKENELFFNKD